MQVTFSSVSIAALRKATESRHARLAAPHRVVGAAVGRRAAVRLARALHLRLVTGHVARLNVGVHCERDEEQENGAAERRHFHFKLVDIGLVNVTKKQRYVSLDGLMYRLPKWLACMQNTNERLNAG